MKRIVLSLALFFSALFAPALMHAQTGGGVSAAMVPPAGVARDGMTADFLTNVPIPCTVSSTSAYLRTASDQQANDVGCLPLTVSMVQGALGLKPCVVTYAASITLTAAGCLYNYVAMTGNITSSTLAAPTAATDSSVQTLWFCAAGTAPLSTFVLPSTVHGTITSLSVALGKCTGVTIQAVLPQSAWMVTGAVISL